MTEEQKEILLADLSARLPYGVKCAEVYPDGNKFENVWDIIRVSKYVEDGVHISNCKTIYGYCSQIQNIKPYLFPLSSMTEEQKDEIRNRFCYEWETDEDVSDLWKHELEFGYALEFIQWCYENHLDIGGLIPKGLAVDCTCLNIY